MNSEKTNSLSFLSLEKTKKENSGWELLRALNASFVMSFFFENFMYENRFGQSENDVLDRLKEHIEKVRQIQKDNQDVDQIMVSLKESAPSDYLSEWVNVKKWLHKKYEDKSYRIYLSPEVEQFLFAFDNAIRREEAVYMESKLNAVLELSRQIIEGTGFYPEAGLASLKKRREELDKKIEAAEKGSLISLYDYEVRDRIVNLKKQLKDIFSDFSTVEDNFKNLERTLREKILLNEEDLSLTSGEIINTYFNLDEEIKNSEQWKSFDSFSSSFYKSTNEMLDLLDLIPGIAGEYKIPFNLDSFSLYSNYQKSFMEISSKTNQMIKNFKKFFEGRVSPVYNSFKEMINEVERKFLLSRETAIAEEKTFFSIDRPFIEPYVVNRRRCVGADCRNNTMIPVKLEVDSTKIDINNFRKSYKNFDRVDCQQIASRLLELIKIKSEFSLGYYFTLFPPAGIKEIIWTLDVLDKQRFEYVQDPCLLESVNIPCKNGNLKRISMPLITITGCQSDLKKEEEKYYVRV